MHGHMNVKKILNVYSVTDYLVINGVSLNTVGCKYNRCIISTEIHTLNSGYISHPQIQYLREQGCKNPWLF
jgi:hypothetical protein